MSAVRQDAWTPEDDLILAEVTLRHIREGSTQLAAFEEVGGRIGRTAAACGFRWNSCVRKKYDASIQIAKSQRQKRNQMRRQAAFVTSTGVLEADSGKSESSMSEESLTIDAVIRFLRGWKTTYQDLTRHIRQLERDLRERDEELGELRSNNERLNKQMSDVQTDYRVVNDDYKALLQIMDRARKLAFLVEEDEDSKAKFKMDANGNLERVE